MIDLELYKIFIIVAKERNITKASEKLNISQPAVTKHIKNLEAQLNTILFKRKNGMVLTQKGEELFRNVAPLIEQLLQVEINFFNYRDINFGTYSTMVSKMLSGCIVQYYEKHKNSRINIVNDKIENMFLKLKNAEIDIILTKKIEDNLYDIQKIKYVKLGYLQDVLIVNNNSELINKVNNINDLKDEIIYLPRNNSISTLKFIKKLKENGMEPNIRKIDSSTMIELIKNGEGIGFITKEYVKDEIKEKKIKVLETDFKLELSEYGIYIQKYNKCKELKDFIEILKEVLNNDYNLKL